MRLHQQILVGLVQLVLPILAVPHIVSGVEAQATLLVVVYVAEFMLWELHNKAVNEAYRRGHRDGAEAGAEKLMPLVDSEPTDDDLQAPSGLILTPLRQLHRG
ncbi:MAG TPA: hypothetical protein VK730_13730 [Solirubrobacteraceae bacterium]|jgi:hypothetical protein|nr:hypothetical protein [Solirubrobacteraceae bacterium]